jgi:hypothetical protein
MSIPCSADFARDFGNVRTVPHPPEMRLDRAVRRSRDIHDNGAGILYSGTSDLDREFVESFACGATKKARQWRTFQEFKREPI